MIDCYSEIGGAGSPTLIMPDNIASVNNIAFRGYMGGLLVQGFKGSNVSGVATMVATFALNSGKIRLDDTNVGGRISVRGFPTTAFYDSSAGTEVDTDSLTASGNALDEALETITYNGVVVYDSDHGQAGTEYPIGTHETPVNNFTDMKTIAVNRTIEKLHIHNDIYIDQDLKDYVIEGKSGKEVVILQNVNVDGCYFRNLYLAGMASGGSFRGEQIALTDGFYGVNGAFTGTGIVGDITIVGDTPTLFENCFVLAYDKTTPKLIMGAVDDLTPYYVSFKGLFGRLEVDNMSGSEQLLIIGIAGGQITLNDTNTAGEIRINGLTSDAVIDNSDGATVLRGNVQASSIEAQATLAILNQLTITDGEVLSQISETSKQIVRDAMALGTAETPALESIDNVIDRIDQNTQE